MLLDRCAGVLALHAAWLLCALPVVTWLGASAALVHSVDCWRRGDSRLLRSFVHGWRLHRRRTLPLGTASALVLVLLLADLVFLMSRESGVAVVLLMGTVGLLGMWGMVHLVLVPVLVLFPGLPVRRCLREALVMAFRQPLSTTGSVCGGLVVAAVLFELWAPLAVLGAGATACLGLRRCYQSLSILGPGPTASLDGADAGADRTSG